MADASNIASYSIDLLGLPTSVTVAAAKATAPGVCTSGAVGVLGL